MSVEEHDDQSVKGHVVQATKKYRRAIDEERELKELVEQRQALENKVEEEDENQEQLDALDPEESTFKKRYGDLRRHSQRIQDEHKKEIKKLEKQIEALANKSVKLPKTEAEISAWSQKYPDVSKMMESIALKKSTEVSSSIKKEMEELQEMKRGVVREKAESELKTLHPDFEVIRKDPAFHEWASVQPKWVQEALYDNDSDAYACSKAITLYKAENKLLTKKQKPSEAASSVSTKGMPKADADAIKKGTFKESQVDRMTASQYEANEEAITNAIRNGTFIYDISGAAR